MAEEQDLLDLLQDQRRAFRGGSNSFGIDFTGPTKEVRAAVASLPKDQQREAMKVWAKTYVDRERKESFGIDDRARALARGTVIGSGLDELTALSADLLNTSSGGTFGAPYDETLAYQRARDDAFDEANPIQSTALKVGGGIASLPITPLSGVGTGGAIAGRVVPSAVVGAGYGTGQGFGEGEGGLENRITSAIGGGILGGAFGAAAPVVGAGIRSGVGYLSDLLSPTGNALRGYARGAVDRLSQAARDDLMSGQTTGRVVGGQAAAPPAPSGAPMLPGAAGRSLVPYGTQAGAGASGGARPPAIDPDAMVLHRGTNLTGHAETIAQRPGEGGARVLQSVTRLGQGAEGRIRQETDAALGPQRDTPGLLREMRRQRSTDANALYGELGNDVTNQALWNSTLQNLTRRPSLQRAINAAVRVATERGYEIVNPFRRLADGRYTIHNRSILPTFMFWDHVKRGIDKQIRSDPGNRDLIATVNALKDELDRLVPGYAAARQRYADQSEVLDAVEEGGRAFRKGVDPNEMRARMDELSNPGRAGYRLGARQNVANIMGEAVDPESAARRAFHSPYARERLALIAGEEGAERLTNRLDTEDMFQRAENQIRGNSATQRRSEYSKLYPSPTSSAGPQELKSQGLTGWALYGVNRIWNAFRSARSDEEHARIASDAARILTASGQEGEAIFQELLRRGNKMARTEQGAAVWDLFSQRLMQATRQPTIEAEPLQ